jgi:hypothetical protein
LIRPDQRIERRSAITPHTVYEIARYGHWMTLILPASNSRRWIAVAAAIVATLSTGGCSKDPPDRTGTGGTTGGAGGAGPPVQGTVVISGAAPHATTATFGVNYWLWSPTWGSTIAGTETDIAMLAPKFLRIGGHNNDNNTPDRFDAAALATAVAYARAIDAQPILQVPLLADAAGVVPTAADAAALVTLANVTGGYQIRYFSIGNEPDLYPDQEATLKTFTPADYCAKATSFVAAMKAVDPSITIVGPDLSWKYQTGANDWLSPILTMCGSVLDVIAVHRYPFAPEASRAAAAPGDAATFRSTINHIRDLMTAAGAGDKPLALTETNITYDGSPEKSTLDASPGTLPAGLWTADMLGTARAANLWTTLYWSVSEGWTLGLETPPPRTLRPAFHALALWGAHSGPTLLAVTSSPTGVSVYASRDAADTKTFAIIVNWNRSDQILTINQTDLAVRAGPVTVVVPAQSVTAVEIVPGAPSAWTYGPEQFAAKSGPAMLVVTGELLE